MTLNELATHLSIEPIPGTWEDMVTHLKSMDPPAPPIDDGGNHPPEGWEPQIGR